MIKEIQTTKYVYGENGKEFFNKLDAIKYMLFRKFVDDHTIYSEKMLSCDQKEFVEFLIKNKDYIEVLFEDART